MSRLGNALVAFLFLALPAATVTAATLEGEVLGLDGPVRIPVYAFPADDETAPAAGEGIVWFEPRDDHWAHRYRIEDLRPGRYLVVTGLRQKQPLIAQEVEVGDEETVTVDLAVPEENRRKLTLRFVDLKTGDPIERVTCWIYLRQVRLRPLHTGAGGEVTVDDMIPGRYRIHFRAPVHRGTLLALEHLPPLVVEEDAEYEIRLQGNLDARKEGYLLQGRYLVEPGDTRRLRVTINRLAVIEDSEVALAEDGSFEVLVRISPGDLLLVDEEGEVLDRKNLWHRQIFYVERLDGR